jgi:hypothetical protein
MTLPPTAALLLALLLLALPGGEAWNNGAALRPPLGWANWNLFGCNYTDSTFRQMADAFVTSGLAGPGNPWEGAFMLVQECIVPLGARDPITHVVQPDATKFPHGLADLSAFFHSRGLRAGIYTDVAAETCAGFEGSGRSKADPVGHWALDALTYAQWGFDMIEADFCHVDDEGDGVTAHVLYSAARDAIAAATAATGRLITFYQCNWGAEAAWLWGPTTANVIRNTGDICSPGSIA